MPPSAAIVIAAILVTATSSGSTFTGPGKQVDLKVLLLSADGNEPTYHAWTAALSREGVPFDAIIATQAAPMTSETLTEGTNRAKYQGVVVATGGLVYSNGAAYVSALSDDEWAVLKEYERTFGIRQVTASVYPGPQYGLNHPSYSGDMGGVAGSLTPAGLEVFPYLVGPVPIDRFAYGYQATPLATSFETLVSGPNGSALAGVYTHPEDGLEELVLTVDTNAWMLHAQLLRHGLLSWVTKGVYLGYQRNYLELQIDDVFLQTRRWDPVTKTTLEPSPRPIRMTAADVARAVDWSRATGLRLDMAYNAGDARDPDSLTEALLDQKASFGWVNHTWSHSNLNSADLATIESEIQRNIDWAVSKGIAIDDTEIVTGEHSGLGNPNSARALQNKGIRWFAADNSREPDQYQLGPALSVPRHPTNVYYNVATREEQLDEFNALHHAPPEAGQASTPTSTNPSAPVTWDEYVDIEARTIFGHVLNNDPRPHYFHQGNLAEDGIFYSVVDEVVRRYRSYLRPPFVSLTTAGAGAALSREQKWSAALCAGQVEAHLLDGKVYVQTTATVEVPITGTSVGTAYGGEMSGWTVVTPGDPSEAGAPQNIGEAPAPDVA